MRRGNVSDEAARYPLSTNKRTVPSREEKSSTVPPLSRWTTMPSAILLSRSRVKSLGTVKSGEHPPYIISTVPVTAACHQYLDIELTSDRDSLTRGRSK